MGTNKARLVLGADMIIGHVLSRLAPQVGDVVVNAAQPIEGLPAVTYLDDPLGGQIGPLAGILAGMRHFGAHQARPTHFLSVPCDSPFLPLDLCHRLREVNPDPQTVVVAASAGRSHPVFALWPVALAADLEIWLGDDGNRRINTFLRRHRQIAVDFPLLQTAAGLLDPFLNINTPDDLSQAHAFAGYLP